MHDPYLFLEDSSSPQTQQWVTEQNQHTRAQLETDSRFAPMAEHILANMQNSGQIPLFSVHDQVLYNFYQDQNHPRGLYRSCALASYTQAQTQWHVLLDLDALAEAEGMDWYLAGVDHCTLMPTRCLLSLNIGGSDRCVIREYDLAQQQFVVGGFEFPYSKTQVTWRDPDSVFVCPAWDDDQLTSAGFSAEVVLHRRGQAWSEAASLIVLPPEVFKVSAWRFLDGDGTAFDVVEVAQDFHRRSYFWLDATQEDAAEPQYLALPTRCVVEAYTHGDLIIRLNADWTYRRADTAGSDEQVFQAGSLIALQCNPATAQLGRAQLLFAPNHAQSLQMIEATLHGLLVLILDNVTSRVISFQHDQTGWLAVPNQIPSNGVIDIVAQPWRSDDFYYLYHHFLQAAQLYCVTGAQAPQLLRAQPPAFDAAQMKVQQCFATSKDGTAIPYFIVSNEEYDLGADTPCLLYVYGGFGVPSLPNYLDNLGEHWLRKGGAYVVANVRGGGEFGPAWHKAAQREGCQRSIDDLLAVAEDLIAQQYTSAAKLALQGGSHGGLLVANALLARPELFGAMVCEVPLLDMLRYTELGAGQSWVAEYGDPAQEKDRSFIEVYSPYQSLEGLKGRCLPRVLLTAASQDDRVHPAHARKMAAKLQAQGHAALFYEASGGHAGNPRQDDTAQDLARVLVFLYQALGMQ